MYNNYSQKRLFSEYDFGSYLRSKTNDLENHISSLRPESFSGDNEEKTFKSLLNNYTVRPLVIMENEKKVNANEANVTMHSTMFGSNETRVVKGLSISVEIPFGGDSDLFYCRPSTYTLSGTPYADVEQNRIILRYETIEKDPETIKQLWQKDIEKIQQYIGWLEKDINGYNNSLENTVKNLLARRKKESDENSSLINALLN